MQIIANEMKQLYWELLQCEPVYKLYNPTNNKTLQQTELMNVNAIKNPTP